MRIARRPVLALLPVLLIAVSGCDIVTDTQMAKAGINKTILASLGGEVHCFMSDPDVAAEAKARGVTRAIVSVPLSGRAATTVRLTPSTVIEPLSTR